MGRFGRSTARAGRGEKIAPHLGISWSTVYRYLRSEAFPERKGRCDAGHSRLDARQDVVLEHWNGDWRNSRKMFQDLQQRGYRGSYPTLARYLRRLRAVDTVVAARGLPASARPTLDAAPRQVLTPRTAAWTVLNEAVELAEAFTALVRGREAAQLDPWLQQAELHIPTDPSRAFRRKPAGDSDRSQPPIPRQPSHP